MEHRKKIYEPITPEEKKNFLQNYMPFLSKGKFVDVATCNEERMPNVAPKLIAKVEHNVIYLVDYVMGTTYSNLKTNPRVSLSFVDERSLTGYQLNGAVTIVGSGEEFDRLAEEFQQIKTNFTVERILYNVRTGEKASPLDIVLPEKFVILKAKVFEIVEISSTGGLKSKFAL
ncbi:MAG: pyridoxamine 5'-phosphate oxidase family protein [Candidatus Omnitrophica bacterium]|nr:pyridoxamine 5'-phosphate oxidase family protein [Candidatus Omnitrophota bacterium]MDD5574360.1 pyridoxamine 5'-phosphate oxidase family protein [Candidatus Omnitrophota bacterium]